MTNNSQVLFISYDGMTDSLGQSQVIPYMIGLSQIGYNITIISAEKPKNYLKEKDSIKYLLNQNNINWAPITYTKHPPIISTIYDIYKIKKLANRLHKKNYFHIVHCRSYISAFVGLYMKKRFKTKFIFDMRGFFADERVDGNIWNLNNIIYRTVYNYFKRKEIEFFSNADYTVSLTNNGKSVIHSWAQIKNQPIPIEVIPCCVDTEHFSKKSINKEKLDAYKNELNISDHDFIFSYLGSTSTWYMLDEMLQFFKALLLRNSRAKFLFITHEDKAHIYSKSKAYQIPEDRIIIKGAKRSDVPTLLSLSNISIFFIKPVFSKKASSPTKMGEIMSLGIPIICNTNVGDLDYLMKQFNAGIVINDFNDEEYNKAITTIDKALEIDSDKIRKEAISFFSLENGVKSYSNIYKILNS